ncbi:outer membrane beta-barrel family protein [Cecembia calidifontis]|jgi:outer membrane receptor protein involved in Fe transport|uniref:Outer membrane receptor protein involved in Fe transport n=1 Tax=Cecembia calidifontis TaxID=1187080 RepID=A0A4Q7PFQ5_9BACT|nr:outer membrane beta-barrel family protein [Cecembia calidifontis]RZS98658.1 outer membrane receptor protein involved in Fe transport [Cecembia calidifontis]
MTVGSVFSQQSGKGLIKGTIIEKDSQSALPFATVTVYNVEKEMLAGSITDADGKFEISLTYGSYFFIVEFMGYEAYQSDLFTLSRNNSPLDVGIIELSSGLSQLDEVIIQGEKPLMELSLDKRIFNVGEDLANAGRTTADILMNLPSVTVDSQGNVRLRGSDNVRILVDGKPSGLVSFKGSQGLQQLPASMVERVEIITNPSARYEAEGMAGVINIILKKESNQGFNGSFEVIAGNPTNLGLSANLNYRHKKINWFINYGVAKRKILREGTLYQEAFGGDSLFISKQETDGRLYTLDNNVRAGLDYYFNEKSVLTGSYLLRRSDANRITDIRYNDFLFDAENLQSYSLRRQDEQEKEPNSEVLLTYKRSFEQKGHELTTVLTYLDYWENSDQVFTENTFSPEGNPIPSRSLLQTSINDEFEKQYLIQVDYTKPIGSEGKLETGLRSSFRNMENDFVVKERDEQGNFNPIPGLDNIFLYQENIHAWYGILGNKTKKLSYQGGMRAEWTDVKTTLVKTNEVNPRDYLNLFPSAHLTYNFDKENGMQLSYSRRVRRPFYNDLSPFMTFSDARNFFSGNPDLDPEFTDAIELGHIKYFEKGTLFSTVFYRNTTDKIERIRTVDNEGNATIRPENLLGEQSFGLEFATDYQIFNWWKIDFNMNFFYAAVDGSNIQNSFTATTYSWNARQNSRFSFGNGITAQVRNNYQGRQRIAQGIRKGIFFMDISASKEVLKRRGTLVLNIADIFNSRRDRYILEGEGFLTVGDFLNVRRQINLSLNYRIRQ